MILATISPELKPKSAKVGPKDPETGTADVVAGRLTLGVGDGVGLFVGIGDGLGLGVAVGVGDGLGLGVFVGVGVGVEPDGVETKAGSSAACTIKLLVKV
jgi:hypothetical protein